MAKSKRESQLSKTDHQKIIDNLKENLCFPDDTQNFIDFITKSSVYVDKSLLTLKEKTKSMALKT